MPIKTFKFRLYPTKKQKRILDFSFDECLIMYNQLLCIRKQAYEKDKTNISRTDCQVLIKNWKLERPQLENIHSQLVSKEANDFNRGRNCVQISILGVLYYFVNIIQNNI